MSIFTFATATSIRFGAGAVSGLSQCSSRLQLPTIDLRFKKRDAVVEAAMNSISMKGNPIDLTPAELHQILGWAT